MALTRDAVLAALKGITDPVSGSDIVAAGVMRALSVEDGSVRFVLEIDPAGPRPTTPCATRPRRRSRQLDGAGEVSVVLTGHAAKAPPDLKPSKPASRRAPRRCPASIT